jgi:uncharacterized protein with von Willebrand factor type A (vWA) domain
MLSGETRSKEMPKHESQINISVDEIRNMGGFDKFVASVKEELREETKEKKRAAKPAKPKGAAPKRPHNKRQPETPRERYDRHSLNAGRLFFVFIMVPYGLYLLTLHGCS